MPTPHPPRPPYPPPGGPAGESDESLAAPLRAGSDAEASRSAALLMARHWRPAQEYAAICLATSGPVAYMVTAGAFHQILDRLVLGEPADGLRPRLLVAVRDTVANWSAEDRISEVLPALQKPAGGRGMRATKSMIPENRTLAERSFHGLSAMEQCLLWHTAVEAEPLDVPAALLGMDPDSAAVALDQAKERFREGCVRAHRDLAPSKDCRYYNRLLDVPIRRGGALLPDVQQHLGECRYCRQAAEQLGQIETAPGALLAEAVLGWGARRYLDSRPGRGSSTGTRGRGSSRHGGGRGHARGRQRLLARIPLPARRADGTARASRTLLTGVGIAGAGLLATVLAVSAWPDGGDSGPVTATTATGAREALPDAQAATPPVTSQLPAAGRPTRLRNASADLCLDAEGGAHAGAHVVLADCSPAPTQQWTYEDDGLLHTAADTGLCLDSHADAGVVILGTCADEGTGRGDDVRYDLTVQGEFLPHWDETLALTATGAVAGTGLEVRARDHSTSQRWLTDPPPAGPGSLSVAGTEAPVGHPADQVTQG
ncbi:RICIN domain-containing protein [Streptomyces sp. NPDC026672]|uniref:RICIN domain-containing protein n=1 Tax=unclassified Streptomyces TaxID=2593676 RepID=UPI0033D894BF